MACTIVLEIEVRCADYRHTSRQPLECSQRAPKCAALSVGRLITIDEYCITSIQGGAKRLNPADNLIDGTGLVIDAHLADNRSW